MLKPVYEGLDMEFNCTVFMCFAYTQQIVPWYDHCNHLATWKIMCLHALVIELNGNNNMIDVVLWLACWAAHDPMH